MTRLVCARTTLEVSPFRCARGCVTGALVRRSPEHARCESQRNRRSDAPLSSPSVRPPPHPPPWRFCIPFGAKERSTKGESERTRDRERAQGVAPDYISSHLSSSNRATFSFWPAIEATRDSWTESSRISPSGFHLRLGSPEDRGSLPLYRSRFRKKGWMRRGTGG